MIIKRRVIKNQKTALEDGKAEEIGQTTTKKTTIKTANLKTIKIRRLIKIIEKEEATSVGLDREIKGIMTIKRAKSLLINFISILFLFLPSSCKQEIPYHSSQAVNPLGWSKSDTLIYSPFINFPKGATLPNRYIVTCQHNVSYPFRELHLFILQGKKDSIIHKDTLTLWLASPSGKWNGEGAGPIYQVSSTPKVLASRYNPKDSIQFFIIPNKPDTLSLKGLLNIGLKLEDTRD